MIINILVVLVMFIPFYVALVYKHTSIITKFMTFFWCIVSTAMMFLCIEAAEYTKELKGEYTWYCIANIIGWFGIDIWLGLKMVFNDTPRDELTK